MTRSQTKKRTSRVGVSRKGLYFLGSASTQIRRWNYTVYIRSQCMEIWDLIVRLRTFWVQNLIWVALFLWHWSLLLHCSSADVSKWIESNRTESNRLSGFLFLFFVGEWIYTFGHCPVRRAREIGARRPKGTGRGVLLRPNLPYHVLVAAVKPVRSLVDASIRRDPVHSP